MTNSTSKRRNLVIAGAAVGALTMVGCGTSAIDTDAAPPPPKTGLIKVSTPDGAGEFQSPTLSKDTLYLAQSASGGSIFQWNLSSLPSKPAGDVQVKPDSTWKPAMPDGIKMEQIAFTGEGRGKKAGALLISKKAKNYNFTGGNSVWSYPYGSDGSATQLAGNQAPAGNGFYTWGDGGSWTPKNTAQGAINYTTKNFPTKTPTAVSIGDGGGVVSADNGYTYFGSLQSGCIYKLSPDKTTANFVYCTQAWGVGGQNASIYSLNEDDEGNVYAVYQGAQDIATKVLKITPKGAAPDTVQAFELPGYMRSVGIDANSDGSKVFITAVDTKLSEQIEPNLILEIETPQWGTADKPAQETPRVTTVPGTPYLNGLVYDDKRNIVFVADNTSGFYMYFR